MSLSSEVDVRGETVDTAIVIIDKFLDDAMLSSLSQVRIIHGKGPGVLRNVVADELKHHPNISEFRLGRYGEGEDGVTIARIG